MLGEQIFNLYKIVILGKYLQFVHDYSLYPHTSQLKQQKPSIPEKGAVDNAGDSEVKDIKQLEKFLA